MAVSYEVIFLGTLPLIDTTQGNEVIENAGGILGSYGSAANPLSGHVQTLAPERLSEDDNDSYDIDNGGGFDSFRINGGAAQDFDAVATYNAVITYADGTTATITATVFQDVNGNTYLAPEEVNNSDQAALTAKPIRSLSLNSVASDTGDMQADRVAGDFKAPVDGTAGQDSMGLGYTDAQNDMITNGSDVILAGDGNDTVAAGDGGDQVFGGLGRDSLGGEGGNDRLEGEAGNDTLSGGTGADTLFGGMDNDSLQGDAGDDLAFGGSGRDTILGGAGHDTLRGMGGDDSLFGGTGDGGNDQLFGESGNDLLDGGDGQDQLWAGSGADTVFGGQGNDSLQGDATSFNLADHPSVGAADTTASFTNNAPFAVDVYRIDAPGVAVFQATIPAGGTITAQVGSGWNFYLTEAGQPTPLELILGEPNLVTSFGDSFNDHLDGGEGDDSVEGGYGEDSLVGGSGADTLSGGLGDDTLEGGQGNDLITGGAGEDRAIFAGPLEDYSFDHGAQGLVVTDAQAGRDGVDTLSGTENLTFGGVTYRLVTGDDGANPALAAPNGGPALIIAQDGNDQGSGQASSDMLFGGAGNDTLAGGEGNDTIAGEADDDLLRGEGGNDSLTGGTGRDTLQGGAGNDTLSGGDGNDSFGFASGSGQDVITDFDLGDPDATGRTNDQLDVSGLVDGQGNQVRTRDVQIADDGNGNALLTFPGGEQVTITGLSPNAAAAPGMLFSMGIPCFASGTRLLTPQGERKIEDLVPGEYVMTPEGARPILWHGMRHLAAEDLCDRPHLRPIKLAAGRFGNGRDLVVSPQHAIRHGGQLIRARHLAQWASGARVARGRRSVTYHHILLPRHALVRAEGTWSESFYPGPQALAMLPRKDQETLALAILAGCPLPGFRGSLAQAYGPHCQPILTATEARALLRGKLVSQT